MSGLPDQRLVSATYDERLDVGYFGDINCRNTLMGDVRYQNVWDHYRTVN